MRLKVFFFDVDGTITGPDKTAWDAIDDGLGVPTEKHMQILKEYRTKEISADDSISGIVKLWNSSGKATESNIKQILLAHQNYRRGALSFIRLLIKNGYKVVLLSGTPDIFLNIVLKKLKGAESHTHTTLEFDNNGKLKWFQYPEDASKEKREFLLQYIKQKGISLSECAVIGNGSNDVEIVKMVGFSAAPKDGSREAVLENVDYVFDNYFGLRRKIESIVGILK